MNTFTLHPQLQQDCHILGTLENNHILLNKNATVPWFILVPETNEKDLLDLPQSQLTEVMTHCTDISNFIKANFPCDKINFASIGNVVPQLHLHIVGRHKDDECWPAPVWGNLENNTGYSEQQIDNIRQKLISS